MYADRYGPQKLNRGSLTLSVGIVGGLVTAAMLSNTVIARHFRDKGITIIDVAPPPPPPPPVDPTPPKQQPKTTVPQHIDHPIPQVPVDPQTPYTPAPDPGPPLTPGTGDGGGAGTVIDPPAPPVPVLRGADVDSRYARDFQPVYPTEERRAGREGVVTLRVLIGVDGRVREVERVAAASDAFWRVTEQRALAKWRFRPATRDGVPYETWKTMTVRFRLEDGE